MKKESFIVKGLAGKKTLRGIISIRGAKNAALKAMAAALLFDSEVELHNIPNTEDIYTMASILRNLGAKVEWRNGHLFIDCASVTSSDLDTKLAGIMRASVVATGPLLSRFGKTTFPEPGGCVIGARPIDQFIMGYKAMGAKVIENDCVFNIEMDKKLSLTDVSIKFDKITVGGTETLMMAAVMGNRVVTLHNCAKEPEIVNVATWLNQCGANISGVGTETITIVGTKGKLLSPKTIYTAIPDRIEAGSYLILGALCSSELTINECRPDHMKSVISLLKTSGVHITISKYANSNGNRSIFITDNGNPNSDFHSFNVQTSVYPGFPTDLQAQIVTYLTQVTGASTVKENIFEGRLKYVVDLTKLGANILIKNPNEISIQGPTKLLAATDDHELNAHDIRAGFAMIMAAIISTGTYVINNTYFVDRGYEKIEERLTLLGAKIDRVQSV